MSNLFREITRADSGHEEGWRDMKHGQWQRVMLLVLVGMEGDVELLKFGKGPGVEPAVDQRGFLGIPLFGFVKADRAEVKAADGTRVVVEDLGDNGEALEIVEADAVVGVEVEWRGEPERAPSAGEDLRAGAVLRREE